MGNNLLFVFIWDKTFFEKSALISTYVMYRLPETHSYKGLKATEFYPSMEQAVTHCTKDSWRAWIL